MGNNNREVAAAGNAAANVKGYANAGANLAEIMTDELDGLSLSFDRIKVPGAAGTVWELPGDNPDEPETAKEVEKTLNKYFVF
jgi:hypothetical protein